MTQLVYFYVDGGVTKYGTVNLAVFAPAANAFRLYEDGTESGSSPIDSQDTDITRNVDANSQVHLRIRVDEVGAGSVGGEATDDYALEVSINLGGFVAVTGASTGVQADSTSTLTDGGATTNRATNGISDPGGGSFVAGEQEEVNGVIENTQLTADNFTEHVWALLLVAAELSNGDTLDFRVTLNGGDPGMTNNVTPRITAQKASALVAGSLLLLGVGK